MSTTGNGSISHPAAGRRRGGFCITIAIVPKDSAVAALVCQGDCVTVHQSLFCAHADNDVPVVLLSHDRLTALTTRRISIVTSVCCQQSRLKLKKLTACRRNDSCWSWINRYGSLIQKQVSVFLLFSTVFTKKVCPSRWAKVSIQSSRIHVVAKIIRTH